MRIATSTIFENGLLGIQNDTVALNKTQLELSSGKSVNEAADNPVAAAQIVSINQAIGITNQYSSNITSAQNLLNLQSSALSSVTTLLQSIQSLSVQASDPSLGQSGRQALVSQLKQQFSDLVGLANSGDGQGGYLFSGNKVNTVPYALNASGSVTYQGDSGQRMAQVSSGQQIPTNDPGNAIFDNVRNGNGTFVVQSASGNSGSGVISTGSVTDYTDPNLLQSLTVQFLSPTTYNVVDHSGNIILANQNYVSGGTITAQGKSFSISGSPAGNDTFTVTPATNQSIFDTVNQLVTQLNQYVSTPAGEAQFNGQLALIQQNLSNGLNQISQQQALVGSRIKELTTQTSINGSLETQYQTALSQNQDVNFAAAASALTQQQLTLQAAEQSFVKIQNLSLFNFLQ
ncbi:MAG TPA: flagellar hook-associated protein FlgL [Burkholderiales bacterium]|nr:flagellar hook-associated protein FlgL [Burkholderiales bacterium]